MRSELNGVFFVNLEKVGRYENLPKHGMKLIMELLNKYPIWFAFVRWSISVCIVLISLAYAYSLTK